MKYYVAQNFEAYINQQPFDNQEVFYLVANVITEIIERFNVIPCERFITDLTTAITQMKCAYLDYYCDMSDTVFSDFMHVNSNMILTDLISSLRVERLRDVCFSVNANVNQSFFHEINSQMPLYEFVPTIFLSEKWIPPRITKAYHGVINSADIFEQHWHENARIIFNDFERKFGVDVCDEFVHDILDVTSRLGGNPHIDMDGVFAYIRAAIHHADNLSSIRFGDKYSWAFSDIMHKFNELSYEFDKRAIYKIHVDCSISDQSNFFIQKYKQVQNHPSQLIPDEIVYHGDYKTALNILEGLTALNLYDYELSSYTEMRAPLSSDADSYQEEMER